MNPFIIPEVVNLSTDFSKRHYPLNRSKSLQGSFAFLFRQHLGGLRSGGRFETESLMVTGPSGSGKTKEISDMIKRFNQSEAKLPDGKPALFIECILDAMGSWKDLGKAILRAMGYPISQSSRATRTEIWARVAYQAQERGIVGIHFDEAQHILRGKSETERLATLDAFKTLMKLPDWPLMLILSGVPELSDYVKEEPQLFRLMTCVSFSDIDLFMRDDNELPPDYTVIHEIVGSYALTAGLSVEATIQTQDFYHCLATAAAFRWGLLIDLAFGAATHAKLTGKTFVSPEDFVEVWVGKTGMNRAVNPFTHVGYQTMFRPEKPFQAAIPG